MFVVLDLLSTAVHERSRYEESQAHSNKPVSAAETINSRGSAAPVYDVFIGVTVCPRPVQRPAPVYGGCGLYQSLYTLYLYPSWTGQSRHRPAGAGGYLYGTPSRVECHAALGHKPFVELKRSCNQPTGCFSISLISAKSCVWH